jgi:hypothetical protein
VINEDQWLMLKMVYGGGPCVIYKKKGKKSKSSPAKESKSSGDVKIEEYKCPSSH